jgi:uncharacterized protein involved in exopolysaccharide biosynthesis
MMSYLSSSRAKIMREANMKNLMRLDARECFKIIKNRRWYALGVFILVASGTAIYAALISDMYKSETRIVIEDIVRPDEFPAPGNRINSIRRVLSDRKFIERMIAELLLYEYVTRTGIVTEDVVKAVQKQIGIKAISSNTYIISFTASDPYFAQWVTRQLAQELIRVRTRWRSESLLATDQFIDHQLRKTSEDIAAQQEKIKKFKQGRPKLTPSLEQQFSDLKHEADKLQKQLDNIQKKKLSIQRAKTEEADKNNETCRIIDEASLPVNAEFPNRLQIILMGIGGGLLLGIGAAFGREILDSAISPATRDSRPAMDDASHRK